jgi:hypothetical protein
MVAFLINDVERGKCFPGKDSENESQARIQRDRLRVDTRKWMAARLAPKKYGDHVSHDVQGDTTPNFQPAALVRVGPAEL